MKQTLITFLIFSISLFATAESNKKRPAKENQIEAEKQAALVNERKKRDEAEAMNEKSRWIWKNNQKDNEVIWLHSYDRPAECKGNLAAVRTRWQMGNHEIIQNLCWYKNEKDKFITIVDPSSYIFSKTKIDAAEFLYVKSDKETREAREAENNRILMDAIADHYLKKQKEEQEQYKVIQQNLLRPPMLCQDMGGGMAMCN